MGAGDSAEPLSAGTPFAEGSARSPCAGGWSCRARRGSGGGRPQPFLSGAARGSAVSLWASSRMPPSHAFKAGDRQARDPERRPRRGHCSLCQDAPVTCQSSGSRTAKLLTWQPFALTPCHTPLPVPAAVPCGRWAEGAAPSPDFRLWIPPTHLHQQGGGASGAPRAVALRSLRPPSGEGVGGERLRRELDHTSAHQSAAVRGRLALRRCRRYAATNTLRVTGGPPQAMDCTCVTQACRAHTLQLHLLRCLFVQVSPCTHSEWSCTGCLEVQLHSEAWSAAGQNASECPFQSIPFKMGGGGFNTII